MKKQNLNLNLAPSGLLEAVRSRTGETGVPLEREQRQMWEKAFGQDLSTVRVHRGSDRLLAALEASALCSRDQIVAGSQGVDPATLTHELVHAAQWLKYGSTADWQAGSISNRDDACEIEAESWEMAPTGAILHPCTAELARHVVGRRLILDCQITGHASPRWRGAPSEKDRVSKNDMLARQRSEAVAKYFEERLRKSLSSYKLQFRYNESFDDDSNIPNDTAVIGSLGRGQRDTIIEAKGNKQADDPKYRRTDLSVRVARVIQESMPVRVRKQWGHSTKTKWWRVGIGASASIDLGAGLTGLRVKITNMYDQEAAGVITAGGGGFGLKVTGGVSWSDDTYFGTDHEVGFEDFHGVHVRYTSAGIGLGIGYSWSYLTFYGMGNGAASINVGGGFKGLDLSASLNAGKLRLYSVPRDYIIEPMDVTEWESYTSEWTTNHSLQVFFPDGSADLAMGRADLDRFAAKVANDIQTQ
jgi:hypothetical protein